MAVDRELAYGDVLNAWRHYLAHDNNGRGVVLIGHSQGAGWLSRLIAQEIDGKAMQARIVSALLIGSSALHVAQGTDVGGSFQTMPLCRNAEQTGCIVSFASFRDTVPPPADTIFGSAPAGMQAACTHPASLQGGSASLDAYLAAGGENVASGADVQSWTAGTASSAIDTAFVRVPDLLSAECVSRNGASYLQVTVNADARDPRTDDIRGDVVIGGEVVPAWGLHLIDMHLAMGDMVRLVQRQGEAFAQRAQ